MMINHATRIVATNGESHDRVLASIQQHLTAEALAAGSGEGHTT
jgi:hypothetical protein